MLPNYELLMTGVLVNISETPLGFTQQFEKLFFIVHAIVGAATSRPRSTSWKLQEMSGEFVPVSRIYTIHPNTQFHNLAGGW